MTKAEFEKVIEVQATNLCAPMLRSMVSRTFAFNQCIQIARTCLQFIERMEKENQVLRKALENMINDPSAPRLGSFNWKGASRQALAKADLIRKGDKECQK